MDWHVGPHPQEYLTSYADLMAWSQHARLVSETQTRQLLAAAAHPALAAAVLQQAITFREALYRLFLATLAQQLPDKADQATFNALHAQVLAHSASEQPPLVYHAKLRQSRQGAPPLPAHAPTHAGKHQLSNPSLTRSRK